MAAAGLRQPYASSLPNAPGVYIFYGDDVAGTPLYVGKSVRVRARVLSHFHNPREAACASPVDADVHAAAWRQALAGLQLHAWPYAGAIGLVERNPQVRQVHAIRDWCYLGSAAPVAAARKLGRAAARYDADAYRILAGPLLRGQATTVAL